MLRIDWKVLGQPINRQSLIIVLLSFEKLSVKYSIENFMLLNFRDLLTMFFARLSDEIYSYARLSLGPIEFKCSIYLVFQKTHSLFKLTSSTAELPQRPKFYLF